MALPASDLTKQADMRTTLELGRVLPKTAQVIDNHLYIGGVDMVELARKEGTALYVYDEEDIRSRMRAYRESFSAYGKDVHIAYASKAFLNKELARIAQDERLWLDVSGGGELACALAAGFNPAHIIMHGNNKTPQELREAISFGVGRIVVDSRIELARVSKIAEELGFEQEIYMRITPGVEADTHEYIKTGCEDSKFGFTMREDWAFNCVKDALEAPHVKLVGFHCHIGSQIFSVHSFAEAIQVMIDFLARVRDTYGVIVDELDLGGGLGIAYFAEDNPSSIEEFAALVIESVRSACAKHSYKPPHLVFEPGRSLVGTAGVTLYTVGILKTLPGVRKYVAIDGGMSDNIRTALYHTNYEPTIANKAGEARSEIVTLCGKHCESGDAVVIDMPLQKAEVGDIVCVFGTGAYCASMSSNYNGQVRPAVVFVRDGKARVVTRRESYEDLLSRDV